MESIFNIFQTLKTSSTYLADSFNIASLPLVGSHKIGISPQEQPMFFIECDNTVSTKFLDVSLEFIGVQYNKKCQLYTENQVNQEGIYTIIALKTDSTDLQSYFLEVVYLVIKKLPSTPTVRELKLEIDKLIDLFSKFSKPPTKTIQGLWAELLVITRAKSVDYLIRSWHISANDKFDFNDGTDKLEVKSTSKSKRIHNFSIEQLNPNKGTNLLIASVIIVETGIGKNIFDLLVLIDKRLKDKDLLFQVNEIIAQTIGKDFEKCFDIYFDYQQAVDSLHFYQGQDIPKIDLLKIPSEISNVRFDADLTNITPMKKSNQKSQLQNALF